MILTTSVLKGEPLWIEEAWFGTEENPKHPATAIRFPFFTYCRINTDHQYIPAARCVIAWLNLRLDMPKQNREWSCSSFCLLQSQWECWEFVVLEKYFLPKKEELWHWFYLCSKMEVLPMEVINSDQVFEEDYDAGEEVLIPFVEKEIVRRYFDHYDEPSYLFRGGIIGLFLCLPFWVIIFWFITWLLISIHFLKIDEVKRSYCVLLSQRLLFLACTLNF